MAEKGGGKPVAEPEESLLRGLDRWWFGYGSPTSLGLFRILIGALAFLNLVSLTTDLPWWYGENGFVPAWLGQAWFGTKIDTGLGFSLNKLNLIGGVTDYRVVVAFFSLTCLLALTTALGLFTRVSAFALALCLVSLHHRNPIILHGGDTAMRIAVLYLAVAPCGRACSLDRLFRLRRGEEDGPVEVSLWGQRLVQFNAALIYFTTVWAKWFGGKWLDGTATWYPARLAEFHRFPVPGFLNELPTVYVATYGTILIEFSLGTLVFFRPLRKYVLFAGVLLHGYIEYAMNIPFFSYLMVSYYVCFYDGEEIAAWARRLGDRLRPVSGLEVILPPDRRLSPTGERFLAAVDPLGLVRYLSASGPLSPQDDRAWGERGRGEGGVRTDPSLGKGRSEAKQADISTPGGAQKVARGRRPPEVAPVSPDPGGVAQWSALKDNGKPAHPFRGVAYRAPGAWLFLLIPGLWRRMMLTSTEAVA